jgi:hypothetical protein
MVLLNSKSTERDYSPILELFQELTSEDFRTFISMLIQSRNRVSAIAAVFRSAFPSTAAVHITHNAMAWSHSDASAGASVP